jgi:curved DNA-binding protein CbpA
VSSPPAHSCVMHAHITKTTGKLHRRQPPTHSLLLLNTTTFLSTSQCPRRYNHFHNHINNHGLITISILRTYLVLSTMPTLDEDPYQVLSLSHSATRKQIRRKYFTLAKRYHPDKVPQHLHQQNEEQFKKIKQAYECLMDPVSRGMVDGERERRDKSARDAAQELLKRQREEQERLAKERNIQERAAGARRQREEAERTAAAEAEARRKREEAAAEAERRAERLRQQAAGAREPARPAASNYGTAGDSPPPYTTAPPSYTSSPPRTPNIPKQPICHFRTYTYNYTTNIHLSERTSLFPSSGGRRRRTPEISAEKVIHILGILLITLLILIVIIVGIHFLLRIPYGRRIAIIGNYLIP